jgi:Rho termination factor, N-terminal domain
MPGKRDPGPSIKDKDRYEAIRDEGMSKEKAARIANTDATTAGRRGGSAPPYEEWTRDELYDKARQVGVDGRSSMTKGELISALRNH